MISEAILMAVLSNPVETKNVDSDLANLAKSIAAIVDKKTKGDVSADEVMDLIVSGKSILTSLVYSIDECIKVLDEPTKDDVKAHLGSKPNDVIIELQRVINHGNNVIMMTNSLYNFAKSTSAFYPFESVADGYFKEIILKLSALRNYTQTIHRQFSQHINQLPAIEDGEIFSEEDIALFNSSVAAFNRELNANNV